MAATWQPEPDWYPLPGASGPSTLGVWRAEVGGRPVAIKRLVRPGPGDPPELTEPTHFSYWRRAADVVTARLAAGTPGLREPEMCAVEEDSEGITLITEWVEDAANSGLFRARGIGRFAGVRLGGIPWLARDQLRSRMARVEGRGGWTTLGSTPAGPVAAQLWERRAELLDELDLLPQVAQHGDPTPANLPGRIDDDVVAVDWGSLGIGPVGGDLGYHLLGARESFEPLLDAYLLGLPDGLGSREEAAQGARVTVVLTAFSRAEWALARVAGGEGDLLSKLRHPAVAPHLRALQRQAPLVRDLLGW